MPNVTIKSVTNERDETLLFVDTEDSGYNQDIPAHRTVDLGAVVPWATTAEAYAQHHMSVTSKATGQVLFTIWQGSAADGDFVRISPAATGFETPGTPIQGNPDAGDKSERNLRIDGGSFQLNNS